MARKQATVRVRLNNSVVWTWLSRRNLSQNDLARLLGISTGYLSQLINGKRSPSAALRRRMGKHLPDLSFDDLFSVEYRDGADGS